MREADSPRGIAVQVLQDAESGRPLASQLESYLRLHPADATFVTELVQGVGRHTARLDSHIDASTRRKPTGRIRQALRIAAFELLELDFPREAVASAVVRILPAEWTPIATELVHTLDRQRHAVAWQFSAHRDELPNLHRDETPQPAPRRNTRGAAQQESGADPEGPGAEKTGV